MRLRAGYSQSVFGLTFDKLLIIGVIAIFVIGPERLPQYAAGLARLVKSLRAMASSAKDRMREEMGPEYDDIDWQSLDPRRYDPRRIIREALLDDPMVPGRSAAQATNGSTTVGPPPTKPLAERAEVTPFDSEAT